MSQDLRFPIGNFDLEQALLARDHDSRIATIAELPGRLRAAVDGLGAEKLDEPYRPEGWSVRQVVHHIADSHINSFCRFKLALTEERPTIRAYHEDRWAALPDSKTDIDSSLKIIDGIHDRWASLLRAMSGTDFKKELEHPESGSWTLEEMLALYDWHSRHHTAHITMLRERMKW